MKTSVSRLARLEVNHSILKQLRLLFSNKPATRKRTATATVSCSSPKFCLEIRICGGFADGDKGPTGNDRSRNSTKSS